MWFIEFGMCGCGGDGERGGLLVECGDGRGFYFYISPAKTEEK